MGLLLNRGELGAHSKFILLALGLTSETAADLLAVLSGVAAEEGNDVGHLGCSVRGCWLRLLPCLHCSGELQSSHWRKIGNMVTPKDPARDEIWKELRIFRKGDGIPAANRLAGLFYLTEALGDGIQERAFDELSRYHQGLGQDPLSDIGAFFYLSGWTVGLGTVDERRKRYLEEHFASDVSTPWRRSERGITELATLIRDRAESHRPWAFVSIFQSGGTFQPVLDFNMSYESWQPPEVFIDHEPIPLDFHVHRDSNKHGRFTRRIVLPESPLRTDVGFAEAMATVRVRWPMPVWPTWSLLSWTADPRIMTHMRTFRERAVEVSLQWWRQTRANETHGLVTDGAIWAERTDPNTMSLPSGWRVEA